MCYLEHFDTNLRDNCIYAIAVLCSADVIFQSE